MHKINEQKLILEGKYENIVEIQDHYYLISKKHKIIVLPYTIDAKGLLNTVGVIKDYNYIFNEYNYTVLNDYISQDDGTNLVCANRILYENLGINITNADNWMYLGKLYNNLNSDSPIYLYCVDVTDKKIEVSEELDQNVKKNKFKMIESSYVVTSDDMILLSAYLRLFNYFYINSLKHK